MTFFQKHKRWVIPALITLLIAPFTPWIDLGIENYFYSIGNDPITHFVETPLTLFIYNYFPLFADFLAGLGLFIFVFSFVFVSLHKYRKPALVFILTLILGGGLMVHLVFKEYWGRPRPKQIEQYGGSQAFRPFWSPQFHPKEPSKSFTCGHCTMGFVFFSLYLVALRKRKTYLAYFFLTLGLFLGITLSITRMAEGGHFFSDTWFSMLIMWYAALISLWLVYARDEAIEIPD